MLKNFTYE